MMARAFVLATLALGYRG